jgi:hypothetical protein
LNHRQGAARRAGRENNKKEKGMGTMWHSAQAMKQLATALLALALVALAVTYAANQKSVTLQGPGALQAIDENTVWLGVNEELWILDRTGRRTGLRSARSLGFTEAVSNIALAPHEQALLTSRGDRDWQLVDRALLAPVRSITPQWPADFASKELRAVHVAVSPQWDIAAATGGGHAVLLFDRDGRLKARTAPGTYQFTNGLWWSAQGWWTTDTNRFRLVLLDATTLQVKSIVSLQAVPHGHPFLGEAVASQGGALPGTPQAPLATLTRMGHWMEPGYAVDVFPDGSQALFHAQPIAQLRDIAWFDGRLLVVDGEDFSMQRFAPDRTADAPFGDPQVRALLRQMRDDRRFWRTFGSQYAFLVAALLLAVGMAAYARHRRLASRAVAAAREAGHAVTGAASLQELARQRIRVYGVPLAVRLVVLLLALFVLFPLLHWCLIGPRPLAVGASLRLLLLCVLVPAVLAAIWQQRRHERLAADAAYEPALNHRAVSWLRDHDDFDRVKLEDEVPRETVFVTGWRQRWLLITNRRVLLFAASARERQLASEWPRRSVVFAGPPSQAPGAPRRSPWLRLLGPTPNLALTFTTGTTLQLRCASTASAHRVAQVLMSSPAIPDETLAIPGGLSVTGPRRWHEVLASFLVPGTGQWLQGRFSTGLALFTAALLLAVYEWWPVAWALQGPKMEVSSLSIAWALLTWVLLALVASSDAWHFSTTRRLR